MMNDDEEAEDCPNETNTKIKAIHNGEQGQGAGPSSATPCVADFHEYFTLVPRSQCYVHAKTIGSEFGCYTIAICFGIDVPKSIMFLPFILTMKPVLDRRWSTSAA